MKLTKGLFLIAVAMSLACGINLVAQTEATADGNQPLAAEPKPVSLKVLAPARFSLTRRPKLAGSQSTLVVDLVDGKSKSSVWRASATQILKEGPSGNPAKDVKRVEEPIRKSVDKMFKQFPKSS